VSFKELYLHKLEDDGLYGKYGSLKELYDTFCRLFEMESDSWLIWDELGEYVRRYGTAKKKLR